MCPLDAGKDPRVDAIRAAGQGVANQQTNGIINRHLGHPLLGFKHARPGMHVPPPAPTYKTSRQQQRRYRMHPRTSAREAGITHGSAGNSRSILLPSGPDGSRECHRSFAICGTVVCAVNAAIGRQWAWTPNATVLKSRLEAASAAISSEFRAPSLHASHSGGCPLSELILNRCPGHRGKTPAAAALRPTAQDGHSGSFAAG